MELTHHAKARSCQRSVPHKVVHAVYVYGACRPAAGGATAFSLDHHAIALAEDDLGAGACELARYIGVYVIVRDEGRVVTIARPHRHHRH